MMKARGTFPNTFLLFSFDTTVITQKLIKMRSPNSKTTGNLNLLQITIEQRLEEQYSY